MMKVMWAHCHPPVHTRYIPQEHFAETQRRRALPSFLVLVAIHLGAACRDLYECSCPELEGSYCLIT